MSGSKTAECNIGVDWNELPTKEWGQCEPLSSLEDCRLSRVLDRVSRHVKVSLKAFLTAMPIQQ